MFLLRSIIEEDEVMVDWIFEILAWFWEYCNGNQFPVDWEVPRQIQLLNIRHKWRINFLPLYFSALFGTRFGSGADLFRRRLKMFHNSLDEKEIDML